MKLLLILLNLMLILCPTFVVLILQFVLNHGCRLSFFLLSNLISLCQELYLLIMVSSIVPKQCLMWRKCFRSSFKVNMRGNSESLDYYKDNFLVCLKSMKVYCRSSWQPRGQDSRLSLPGPGFSLWSGRNHKLWCDQEKKHTVNQKFESRNLFVKYRILSSFEEVYILLFADRNLENVYVNVIQ